MKTITRLALLTLVAACAGTPEIPADTEAVLDYVEVGAIE